MVKACILKEELFIEQIQILRGEKILLDFQLAELYGVDVKQLKRSVNRNIERFPVDFMFQTTKDEYELFHTKSGRGAYAKFLPYAFTEQGVAMLSGILRSQRAIDVNIVIMRSFVQMRRFVDLNKGLIKKVSELEKSIEARLDNQDDKIKTIFETIKFLIKENTKPKSKIGFV